MKLRGRSLRPVRSILAPSLLVLSLGACNTVSVFKGAGYSDVRLAERIDKAYAARDACLAKNAVPSSAGQADVASVAQAVSLACLPETNQLVAVTNPYQDPHITQEIMKDTDAKAVRYVRLANGEGVSN